MVNTFRGLILGRMGTGFLYHATQTFRIFQHRTRLEHIIIKGLTVVIGHKQRRLICFQQGLFTDVGVRVMDKSARLNVTIGIDMQIVAATSNTAVYKFRIILKVNCENRLCATVFADAVIHLFTLVRRREQLHSGIVAHRHIVEEPCELRTALHQMIEELIRADGVDVLAGIAPRYAERQLLSFRIFIARIVA